MIKSREELVTRVLQKLQVTGAGQSPSAEDAALVYAEIDPVMSDLAARNIWIWGDPDQIDAAAFVHLADIIANSVATSFGKNQDETMRLMAESRLTALGDFADAGQPIEAFYY